jgi:asparagine synthase (glutamine-hydrolysing)
MLHSMEHGPFYTSTMYVNEHLGLGIGRVSLRGAFDDTPPIWNETKDICLLFAGDDFPDHDSVQHLISRGHQWNQGASGYLVHLYEEKGLSCLASLNGRFCGILVDLREPAAFLFNDRYGLSKVYYHQNAEGCYFSSEAKSLLKILPELRCTDYRGLAETFSCGCVLQNRTLFPGISLLPPGSLWIFRPGKEVERDAYFVASPWENQESLSATDYYEKLKETWARLLPRYLRNPDRVAVSLTGGKDSQMIMAWAKAPPGSLPCYTFGGMYRDSRDVKLGRKIAVALRQPHQVIALDQAFLREFPALAEQTVYLSDGAMDVSGAAELYVNRIARQIAPIRLTGNYGQEILHRAVAFKPSRFHASLLSRDFATLVEGAAATYRQELAGNPLSFVAFKQVPWHHTSRLALELTQLELRSPYLDNDLVALSYREPKAGPIESSQIQLKLIADGNSALAEIGTDRALRARRTPLMMDIAHLWQEFTFKAEYAFDYGMPQWLAYLDNVGKILHLERLFLGRHKYYHFRIWYRDALSSYIKEILLDPLTLKRPHLNQRAVEKAVLDHSSGRSNYTSAIHRLLTAELFHRLFTD